MCVCVCVCGGGLLKLNGCGDEVLSRVAIVVGGKGGLCMCSTSLNHRNDNSGNGTGCSSQNRYGEVERGVGCMSSTVMHLFTTLQLHLLGLLNVEDVNTNTVNSQMQFKLK